MKSSLRTLAAAAALVCVASASAAAQNNSDAISIGVSSAVVGGAYTPNNGGNQTIVQVNAGSVRAEISALTNAGGTNAQVGAAISGNGAALSTSLTSSGAPAAQTGALMTALANLGANPSPAALSAAIQAYNALVAAVPQGMVANPPPALMSVRAALVSIRAGK